MALAAPTATPFHFHPSISSPLKRNTQKHGLMVANSRTSSATIHAKIPISVTNMAMKQRKISNLRLVASAAVEQQEKIPFSNVVVIPSTRPFWLRKWKPREIGTGVGMVALHVLCLFAPFTFNWSAFWVAVSLYVITGMFGITLCYHRQLSHKSFKLPKLLEYLFAYCGHHAVQGDPITWVAKHRYHHQFTDTLRDPHSPIEGFWFSHLYWMFDSNYLYQKYGKANNAKDLEKQPFYKFLQRTAFLHHVLLAVLLYSWGGFPFLVWALGVRVVAFSHATFAVNSVCHIWGDQAWNTGDLSRNNWLVALIIFGEGWHNNHHAFEYSARHGLEWWQLDMTWWVIKLLENVGLATDVKLPSEAYKQKLYFKSEEDSDVLSEFHKQKMSFNNVTELSTT